MSTFTPINVVIELICCKNADLFYTDMTLEFMLVELPNKQFTKQKKFYPQIHKLADRRNNTKDINSNLYDPKDNNIFFPKPWKACILKNIFNFIIKQRVLDRQTVQFP